MQNYSSNQTFFDCVQAHRGVARAPSHAEPLVDMSEVLPDRTKFRDMAHQLKIKILLPMRAGSSRVDDLCAMQNR